MYRYYKEEVVTTLLSAWVNDEDGFQEKIDEIADFEGGYITLERGRPITYMMEFENDIPSKKKLREIRIKNFNIMKKVIDEQPEPEPIQADDFDWDNLQPNKTLEIRFKAQREDNEEWVEGYYLCASAQDFGEDVPLAAARICHAIITDMDNGSIRYYIKPSTLEML